ncbi:MAG: hypothetical protein HC838_08275 [Spirulinaceae cyanobacterium RM2_2_10]|nr:hypothetical protein [Spirulinaceae cyanobacterium RM2_2_10]
MPTGWLTENGCLLGRCSLWWRQTPTWAGAPLGYIGHWAASAAAPELLAQAGDHLAAQGCQQAIRPP